MSEVLIANMDIPPSKKVCVDGNKSVAQFNVFKRGME
jgi:hypothetical protein